jgi:P-type E1-E2 ATPase
MHIDSLMEKFKALQPEAASVIRDGVTKPVPATDIVIGDVIRLKSGDKIPADCRIIFNQSMKVDQVRYTCMRVVICIHLYIYIYMYIYIFTHMQMHT